MFHCQGKVGHFSVSVDNYSIRGARDLAALWGELPVAVWVFPLRELPDGVGILALNNALRASAWRTFCAARQSQPCVVAGQDCAVGGCLTMPLNAGGCAAGWRNGVAVVRRGCG